MSRLAASLVLIAACAAPQEPRSTLPPGETPPNPEAAQDEPVCREESVTGSSIKRTICRTPEEMKRERQNAEEFHERGNLTPTMPRPD